jgi:hypothetical protein
MVRTVCLDFIIKINHSNKSLQNRFKNVMKDVLLQVSVRLSWLGFSVQHQLSRMGHI